MIELCALLSPACLTVYLSDFNECSATIAYKDVFGGTLCNFQFVFLVNLVFVVLLVSEIHASTSGDECF